MKLHDFPFDTQQLKVVVRLPHRMDMGRHFKADLNQLNWKDYLNLEVWSSC
jgi:hypothetical protein